MFSSKHIVVFCVHNFDMVSSYIPSSIVELLCLALRTCMRAFLVLNPVVAAIRDLTQVYLFIFLQVLFLRDTRNLGPLQLKIARDTIIT